MNIMELQTLWSQGDKKKSIATAVGPRTWMAHASPERYIFMRCHSHGSATSWSINYMAILYSLCSGPHQTAITQHTLSTDAHTCSDNSIQPTVETKLKRWANFRQEITWLYPGVICSATSTIQSSMMPGQKHSVTDSFVMYLSLRVHVYQCCYASASLNILSSSNIIHFIFFTIYLTYVVMRKSCTSCLWGQLCSSQ